MRYVFFNHQAEPTGRIANVHQHFHSYAYNIQRTRGKKVFLFLPAIIFGSGRCNLISFSRYLTHPVLPYLNPRGTPDCPAISILANWMEANDDLILLYFPLIERPEG